MYNEHEPTDIQRVSAFPRGRLITFEGIDGSGKTTQIEKLSARLAESGIPVRVLREPGGTVIGEAIRRILLDKAHTGMCTETELLLFAAARAQLVREVILPDLEAGKWVICDRFLDSTAAYQGFGRQLDRTRSFLNRLAVGTCRPDLTILLDLPVQAALDRLVGRRTAGPPGPRKCRVHGADTPGIQAARTGGAGSDHRDGRRLAGNRTCREDLPQN